MIKKGDKVVCVDNDGSDYLTLGKSYDVVTGAGDANMFDEECYGGGFEIVDDDGDLIYCRYPKGRHGRFVKV